jgi:hypothetical protein
VATLYPNVTLKHTWGNWFVEGNLSIVGQTEFLFYGSPSRRTHTRTRTVLTGDGGLLAQLLCQSRELRT